MKRGRDTKVHCILANRNVLCVIELSDLASTQLAVTTKDKFHMLTSTKFDLVSLST